MSNFNFNSLFIIQSLRDKDPKIGEDLKTRINDWCLSKKDKPRAEVFNVETLDEWENAWDNIHRQIDAGYCPIIHLVMHGNETHIGLHGGDNGIVTLTELYEKLRNINVLLKNSLFVSMAVCEGLNVARGLKISEPMPFCGLLASEEPLYTIPALENFTIFYKSLLSDLNLNKAKDELDNQGQEVHKYKLLFPEEIFMNAMAGYLESQSKESVIERRAEKIAKDGGFDISDPNDRRKFINDVRPLVKEKDTKAYPEYLKKFFMLDIYPEISERFSVPKTLDDFKARAKAEGIDLY